MVKKVVALLVIGFVVFYVVSQPVGAAGAVRGAFDAIMSAFASLITFFTALFG